VSISSGPAFVLRFVALVSPPLVGVIAFSTAAISSTLTAPLPRLDASGGGAGVVELALVELDAAGASGSVVAPVSEVWGAVESVVVVVVSVVVVDVAAVVELLR
jgi:hypothetical protein